MRAATKAICLSTALFLLASLQSTAFADDMSNFKQVYGAYLKAMDDKDWDQALQLSKEALDQGLTVFNKGGQNVANLRFNYARELNRAGKADQAVQQLKLCLDANEKMHGANAPEVVGALMELGKTLAASDSTAAQKYFARAVSITDKSKDTLLATQLRLEAGLSLVENGNLTPDAERYLEDARNFYSKRYGAADGRAGLAALNLGRIYAANHDNAKARETLNGALKAFTGKDPISKRFDIGTRRLLVPVLQAMGRADEATPHCVAIALDNAAGGSAQPELLYRDEVDIRAAKKRHGLVETGEVTVAYTVDATGQPVNVTVESSNDTGLNNDAIRAVKSFRFAPAVAAGKPVATPDMEFHYRLNQRRKQGAVD